MGRPRICFICYSHEDGTWMQQLVEALRAQTAGRPECAVWCDKDIPPGAEWRKAIDQRLRQAQGAVLLVSADFYKSNFIQNCEYPRLREAYEKEGIWLTWVQVGPADVPTAFMDFSRFQPLHDIDRPLSELEKSEAATTIEEIARDLLRLLDGTLPRSLPRKSRLRRKLLRRGSQRRRSTKPVDDPGDEDGKRRGRRSLLLAGLGAVLLPMAPYFTPRRTINRSQLNVLLHQNVWIGYEPSQFDPRFGFDVSVESIRYELRQLRSRGFTGIVTYSARGNLALVPEIAAETDLKVIMGVWDPLDADETEQAFRKSEHVAAYCLGHNNLNRPHSEADLLRAIDQMRNRTGRPVTTTQLSRDYTDDSRELNLAGDFLFPDSHVYFDFDVARDVQASLAVARRLADLARRYDRPLMLKILTYPYKNDAEQPPDFQRQAAYYRDLIDAFRDPVNGPAVPPAYAAHSAFDAPWKTDGIFRKWDPFTGLFEHPQIPRPAADEFLRLHR